LPRTVTEPQLQLSKKECDIMVDLLELWAEGEADAKDLTIEDRSLSDDELMLATRGLSDHIRAINQIKEKIVEYRTELHDE
jgi:hypothetical protein